MHILFLSLLFLPAASWFRPPQPKVASLPETSASLAIDLHHLLDLNRDGVVSFYEFERLLEHYNVQSAEDYDINAEEGADLFQQLDKDKDSKISTTEIAQALRHQSNFKAMTSEDVQVWLEKCTDLKKYRAHFLENDAKGTDLMNPALSEAASVRNILHDQEHKLLRAAVMGALLRSYYLSNRTAYISAPKLVEVRATLITMKIIRPEKRSRFRVVKYKVQICRTSAKASWRRTTVPECGFGWKSIWPTEGISEVRFVGLSPVTSYKLRVRAFHCDGKSISGDTMDVQTLPKPTATQILLSPNKWLKLCYLTPLTPVAPLLISRTAHAVLLEWGKSCTIDSSLLRLSQECGEQEGGGAGWGIPIVRGVSKFLHEQMYCTKQRFVVQYVELQRVDGGGGSHRWSRSGGAPSSLDIDIDTRESTDVAIATTDTIDTTDTTDTIATTDTTDTTDTRDTRDTRDSRGTTVQVIDAHCAQQDAMENTMNDNPLDCLVKDLKPGTMYSFRLAVEANGMLSEFSNPQHIMTHCIRDADCAWGDSSSGSSDTPSATTNATCNSHTRLCEGFDPIQLNRGLSKATSRWNTQTHYIPLSSSFILLLCTVCVSTLLLYPNLVPGRYSRDSATAMHHSMNGQNPCVIDHNGNRVLTKFGPDLVHLECRPMANMHKW